jgi:glycosyltransferase involved in cell wall biosynthesis
MLRALHQHYGPFSAAGVIYNGRRADLFQAQPKEPLILTVGRLWDEAKNLRILAAAAPQLSWPVYCAGATADPGQRATNAVASPAEHIKPLGQLAPSAVAAWMGRAAIYALPATYEPFGLSALEAALSRCALVLGDIPSLREIWGDAACWVAPHDQAGLVAALEALIAAPATQRAFATRAYHRAQRYQTAVMGAAYWRLYNRLATPAHPRINLLPTQAVAHALAAD